MKTRIHLVLVSILATLFLSSAVLAQNTVSGLTVDWEPYYGKNLQNGGFVTEITREAFKRTGWNYELTFVPWKRAVELVRQGKKEVVQGAYFSKERTKDFYITDAFASVDICFFVRKGSNIKFSQMKDLDGYKIGTLLGYSYPQIFNDADYLTKQEGQTMKSNLQKLKAGRLDIVIGGKEFIRDTINRELPGSKDEFVILGDPIQTNRLHNLISRSIENGEKIAADFNKGLKMIKEDGTLDNIMKKHGF